MANANFSGEEQARRISVLYDTALLIGAAEDYDAIVNGVSRHLRAVIPVECTWLLLAAESGLRVVATLGDTAFEEDAPCPFNPNLLLRIANQEENSWFSGQEALLRLLPAKTIPEGLTSLIVCPLQRGDHPEGYLIMGCGQPDAYDRADALLLFLLGLQMATVLRNIRLHAELLESHYRLNLIFNNIEAGMLLLDVDGVVQSANPPVRDFFFQDGPPEIGSHFPEYLIERKNRYRLGRWVAVLRKLTAHTPEEFPLSFELVACDEETRSGRTVAVDPEIVTDAIFVEILLIEKGGKRHGMLVLLRDIQELKKADELRKDLTAMLVHDLRSPLGIINWNMEMILDGVTGEVTPRQEKLLRGSIENSRELLNMVDSLLDIDRLETGSLLLDIETIDVSRLIQDLIEHMDILSRQMALTFDFEYDGSLPQAMGDRMLLRRILFNLLFNASKYSPPESAIAVTLDFKKDIDSFVISITDQGPGIPAKYRNLIFDKYVQVQARSRGEVKSKGLGLTFCKLAVEAHGGSIWVESEEGKGATFRFTLPREYSEPLS